MIAFLKKEDKEKDTELGGLRQDLKDLHHETHKEREVLVQEYSEEVKTLDEQLKEKTQEVCGLDFSMFVTNEEDKGPGGGLWIK